MRGHTLLTNLVILFMHTCTPKKTLKLPIFTCYHWWIPAWMWSTCKKKYHWVGRYNFIDTLHSHQVKNYSFVISSSCLIPHADSVIGGVVMWIEDIIDWSVLQDSSETPFFLFLLSEAFKVFLSKYSWICSSDLPFVSGRTIQDRMLPTRLAPPKKKNTLWAPIASARNGYICRREGNNK